MKEASPHNPWLYSLLLLLALIPAWFLHTKGVDWGDDYAQYIHQARHIGHASGPYSQVLNIDHYGTPKKSIFFSACLSFINSTSTIKPYQLLNTCFYVCSAFFVFLFFSGFFKPLASMASTLLIYYNPRLLDAKDDVLPEFVFMGLLYMVLFLHNMKSGNPGALSPAGRMRLFIYRYRHVLNPLLLACLLATRSMALAIIVPYFISEILHAIRFPQDKKWFGVFGGLACFGLCFLLIQSLFLPEIPQHEIGFYTHIIRQGISTELIWQNTQSYAHHLCLFFEFELPRWVNLAFCSIFLTLFISGIWSAIKNGSHFSLVILFLYLFVLCLYPYDGDAIRYLIPVIPLVFCLLIQGFTLLARLFRKNMPATVAAGILISACLGAELKTLQVNHKIRPYTEGPFETSMIKDFQALKQLVKPTESVAFCKPFLVNLLAERNSYYMHPDSANTAADYILVTKNKNAEEPYRLNPEHLHMTADTLALSNFYLLRLRFSHAAE